MVTISQLSEDKVYMETQTILFDGYIEPDSDLVALQLPVGSKLSAMMVTFWLHPFHFKHMIEAIKLFFFMFCSSHTRSFWLKYSCIIFGWHISTFNYAASHL